MQKLRFVLIAAASVAILLALPTGAASAKRTAYRTYVACGVTASADPSGRCPQGRQVGAFFRALRGDASYTICVTFPASKPKCAQAQHADKGTLYVNAITSNTLGLHKVTWSVKHQVVGVRYFRIT